MFGRVASLALLATSIFSRLAWAAPADTPISPGFAYGSQKGAFFSITASAAHAHICCAKTVRGVNLGGWLVLEVR